MDRIPAVARDLGVTLGLVAAATLLRFGLGLIASSVTPFAGYYLAALGVTILCGWRYGALAVVLGGAAAWWLFLAPISGNPLMQVGAPVSALVFGVSAGAEVAVAEYMRRLVARLRDNRSALAERNHHYDTLIERMNEGFALCEAIWGEDGRLADYTILEINPALQRMLGVGPEAAGSKYGAGADPQAAWLTLCERVMRSGAAERFEYAAANGRHYEIRINRVTETRMAQFFFDITARKAAQDHQAALFEELNHRVKNNLALVAALLQLQARDASASVRDELLKAVDRVQSIAQVHQALYLGSGRGSVDFAAYLKDLASSLVQSLAAEGRVSLAVEAEAVELPMDIVIPLGMVVNELVTNAVKHAYPPPVSGVVSIGFRREGAALRLTVADSGPGLPKSSRRSGGLGMRLVNSLLGQVKGEMAVRATPGATFEITLPAESMGSLAGDDQLRV